MGKMIACTSFVRGASIQSPSVAGAIQADYIKLADPATTNQKHAYPAASQGINTALYINFPENNEGQNTVWLVNELVASFTHYIYITRGWRAEELKAMSKNMQESLDKKLKDLQDAAQVYDERVGGPDLC